MGEAVATQHSGYGAGLEVSAELVGEPEWTDHHVLDRPVAITDRDVRCAGMVFDHRAQVERPCGKKLAELVGRPWRLVCPRCKATNRSPV